MAFRSFVEFLTFLLIFISFISCIVAENDGNEKVGGICLRCNNIEAALTGVDVSAIPIVDPQLHNPAIKGIIFQVEPDSTWIDTYKEINCIGNFMNSTYSNYSEYIFGATFSHSSGFGLNFGGNTEGSGKNISGSGVTMSTTVPSMFSRSESNSEDGSVMFRYYVSHNGSISHTEARCSIYTTTIYPENPRIKYTNNFMDRLREIDRAESLSEKNSVMRRFMEQYGTHYAKKTTMGVGLKFETRWTEEEKNFYSAATLNICNVINGAKVFGIQVEENSNDCEKNLLNITTGSIDGARRFASTSYGSYPHEDLSKWQDSVAAADAADTLDPLPLDQEYDLILNLFNTTAVKAIKHLDGTPVNITRITETALYGYERYCYLFDDIPCKTSGCSSSVRIGDIVFDYASTDENNRIIFEEWTSSGPKRQLFFKNNHWIISNGPFDVESPEISSANCPLSGATFSLSDIDFEQKTSNWHSCYVKCSRRAHCNYWEYKIEQKHCTMIRDFRYMSSTSQETLIGTRDCPGELNLRQSVFGTCVENHPKMWLTNGEEFFQKELKVEINDPSSIVVSGGYRMGSNLASVEILGQNDCSWPVTDLPYEVRSHSMAFTPEGTMILCGGDKHPKSCLSYNIDQKEWKQHSTMIHQREASCSVTLPSGVYVLGGFDAPHSTEFLPIGSKHWIEGPEIPVATSLSCAVSLSKTQFIIIGGGGRYSDVYSHVEMYEASPIFRWNTWPSLKEARKAHGCAKLGNKIIVAGGIGKWGGLKSTEIIDVNTGSVRSGGNMQAARRYFSMATLGGQYQYIQAIGGSKSILGVETDIGSIEKWNNEQETWEISPNNLNTPRRRASLVAVPHARIC